MVFSGSQFPSRLPGVNILSLKYTTEDDFVESNINSATFITQTKQLIVEVQQTCGYTSKPTIFVFQLHFQGSQASSSLPITIQLLGALPTTLCTHFLGTTIRANRPKLVFLDHNSWVISIDAALLTAEKQYMQHFHVPSELTRGSYDMLPLQSAEDDFIFYAYDRIAIVKNGLQFSKMYPIV